MKWIDAYDQTAELERLGIDILTGEACGLSMRLLCDLSLAGADLLTEFLGGCVPQAPAWNGPHKSAMLSRSVLAELLTYALCTRAGYAVVLRCNDNQRNGWLCFATQGHYTDWRAEHLAWDYVRRYSAEGTASGGARNEHVFSGRVE